MNFPFVNVLAYGGFILFFLPIVKIYAVKLLSKREDFSVVVGATTFYINMHNDSDTPSPSPHS